MESIVEVEGLGKRYSLRHRRNGTRASLRDVLTNKAKNLFHCNGVEESANHARRLEDFWALRDISFAVNRGEVLGVIGRNGAGKSTLLKILSRITDPTEGSARIRGRVASLLEVGTGFHPELTGRENIFLNGAILGMTRMEIKGRFDEIAAFAEIDKFLDTPAKHYSNGMYVRLAFAVAAHLEPEILVIDEILAVGDSAFQKKCLGKMKNVAREGRTVLFVSHNVAAVLSLCTHALILHQGQLMQHGFARDVVRDYQSLDVNTCAVPLHQRQDRSGDGTARLHSIQIQTLEGDDVIRSTSRLKVTISYQSMCQLLRPTFLVAVYDQSNTGIFLLSSEATNGLADTLPPQGTVVCVTEPINLTKGRCYINVALIQGGVMADHVYNASFFDVETEDVYGSGKEPARDWVMCILRHKWALGETRN